MNVAIIGAGVCGATVAFRLQEQFGNSISVTIFSDEFSPNTTSDVAGEEFDFSTYFVFYFHSLISIPFSRSMVAAQFGQHTSGTSCVIESTFIKIEMNL